LKYNKVKIQSESSKGVLGAALQLNSPKQWWITSNGDILPTVWGKSCWRYSHRKYHSGRVNFMVSLNKYLALIQERPDLFRNLGELGEIKIIHDPEWIIAVQNGFRQNCAPKEILSIGLT
jgi:hypothetical protein